MSDHGHSGALALFELSDVEVDRALNAVLQPRSEAARRLRRDRAIERAERLHPSAISARIQERQGFSALEAASILHSTPGEAREWFLGREQVVTGPFTVQRVQWMRLQEEVGAGWKAWRPGMTAWVELEQVPELEVAMPKRSSEGAVAVRSAATVLASGLSHAPAAQAPCAELASEPATEPAAQAAAKPVDQLDAERETEQPRRPVVGLVLCSFLLGAAGASVVAQQAFEASHPQPESRPAVARAVTRVRAPVAPVASKAPAAALVSPVGAVAHPATGHVAPASAKVKPVTAKPTVAARHQAADGSEESIQSAVGQRPPAPPTTPRVDDAFDAAFGDSGGESAP